MPKPPTEKPPAGPAVLGSSKASVDALLGRPVMARSLLGMTAQGEKAYSYSQAGDDIVVGFFDDVARYLAVIRKSGSKPGFSPAEMASILALNGAPADWKSEKSEDPAQAKTTKVPKKTISPAQPATYFSFSDKDRDVIGWQPGDKPFVFFLLPSYPGQPHILLNEWQIARAIG
ncbi:MAG: hypothetical protein WCS31_00300 [Verrucomicrobiae bacterium]